jgi:cell division septation protein DedD
MGEEGRARSEGAAGEQARGGYSILIGEETMQSFMESGDFSSARELEQFMELGSKVETRLHEDGGHSIMALNLGPKRVSRDFAVLQIAHVMAKHGRSVLIVDCDFLSPGLSGLVEATEEHGFLDLLLYGSSLGTVIRPSGIDNVNIVGPGSFPVSRTVPFAQKEFVKIRDFLARNSDIVIYCSTLHTDDGRINPLAGQVDRILLTCRVEEMAEGQLHANLQEIPPGYPPADLVCFGAGREKAAPAPAREPAQAPAAAAPAAHAPAAPEREAGEDEETAEAGPPPEAIEKTAEVWDEREERSGGVNLPRVVTIAVAAVVVVFVGWWFFIHRTISEKEGATRTAELVQKQRDAHELSERRQTGGSAADSTAAAQQTAQQTAGGAAQPGAEETGGTTPASEETGAAQQEAPAAGQTGTAGQSGQTERTVPPAEAEPEQKPATVTPAPAGSHFSIHVASFRDMEHAGIETDYLEKHGYVTSIQEAEVKGQTWYRVLAGEYRTKEEAKNARTALLGLPRIGYAKIVTVKDK